MRTVAITAAAIMGLASGASAFVKPTLPSKGRSLTMSSIYSSSQIAERELEAGTTAPFGATFDPLGLSKDKSK